MVVDVTTTPTFKAGIPRALPALVTLTQPARGYDVSGDGQQFFTLRETKATMLPSPTQMIVVLNWVEELKRRVAAEIDIAHDEASRSGFDTASKEK